MLTFAEFAAHHMYPPTHRKPGSETYAPINIPNWARFQVLEAVAYAKQHARQRFIYDSRHTISHVRIQVDGELTFWQYLAWLRHVGEPRFGHYNGRLIGFVRLHKPPRVHRNRIMRRATFLAYLEITIAREPTARSLINRLVFSDRQVRKDAEPFLVDLGGDQGDIRMQHQHARTIFNNLPPY